MKNLPLNYLNLPEEVIKDANNKAKYIYDTVGNKIKAIVTSA